MKRVAILVLMLAALAQIGCGKKDDSPRVQKTSVFTDSATGCQYLQGGGGITPRLDAAGKHICGQ